jgi:hypothetical protein
MQVSLVPSARVSHHMATALLKVAERRNCDRHCFDTTVWTSLIDPERKEVAPLICFSNWTGFSVL